MSGIYLALRCFGKARFRPVLLAHAVGYSHMFLLVPQHLKCRARHPVLRLGTPFTLFSTGDCSFLCKFISIDILSCSSYRLGFNHNLVDRLHVEIEKV